MFRGEVLGPNWEGSGHAECCSGPGLGLGKECLSLCSLSSWTFDFPQPPLHGAAETEGDPAASRLMLSLVKMEGPEARAEQLRGDLPDAGLALPSNSGPAVMRDVYVVVSEMCRQQQLRHIQRAEAAFLWLRQNHNYCLFGILFHINNLRQSRALVVKSF